MKIFGLYYTSMHEENSKVEYAGWFETVELARECVLTHFEDAEKMVIEEIILNEFDSGAKLEVYENESGLIWRSEFASTDIKLGHLSSPQRHIPKLKNQYLGALLDYEGDDDIYAFRGTIVDFKEEKCDLSILVTLEDQEEQCFDLCWNKIDLNNIIVEED